MKTNVDVVVVGAGPVGLLAAIELTVGGARVLVLERLMTPSTISKALGVGPLGVEALQRRGMAAALAAEEERNLAVMERAGVRMRGPAVKFSGHFGFLFIARDAQREPERRMRLIDQQGLEAILADHARSLGIEVRRGHEVISFAQEAGGVDVEWTSPAGSRGGTRCAYLVGCDGGRSAVRKMGGFDFPGAPPTMTMYQALADIDDAARSLPAGWHHTSRGVFGHGPFPRRIFLMDFSGPPEDRQAPVTHDEFEAVLRRISGTDVRVKVLENASRWTDNTRLVDNYRRGRVLLAGDAAHVHSPFGGQGLSLGLVDAANLGWKLAAVVRGEKPESLLDTYTAERRPVAEAVLANTLAQAAIMRPDPRSSAMRDVMASLMKLDDVNRLLGEMMRGLSSRYDLGTERDDVGRLIGDRPIGRGEAQGSLYDVMREGAGVLLDASTDGTASRLVAATTDQIRCVASAAGPSMLIRPDGCVAWQDDERGMDGLEEALGSWFAPARTTVYAAQLPNVSSNA